MNRAEEDYLKTIYIHTTEKNINLVKLQDVSSFLNITIQTAHEMIKKLQTKKMVKYLPYKGVKLTKKGRYEAERMIRAHRILEVFLTETLGFNWAEVHEDAELLEHAASKKVIDALDNFLDNPKYDPHGHPIPSLKSNNLPLSMTSIYHLNVLDKFQINRVEENASLLKFLDNNKIKINDTFTLTNKDKELGIIEIKNNQTHIINNNIAKMIYVSVID